MPKRSVRDSADLYLGIDPLYFIYQAEECYKNAQVHLVFSLVAA